MHAFSKMQTFTSAAGQRVVRDIVDQRADDVYVVNVQDGQNWQLFAYDTLKASQLRQPPLHSETAYLDVVGSPMSNDEKLRSFIAGIQLIRRTISHADVQKLAIEMGLVTGQTSSVPPTQHVPTAGSTSAAYNHRYGAGGNYRYFN
jgi:hypothetical protein